MDDATSVYGEGDAALTVSIKAGDMAPGEDVNSLLTLARVPGTVVGKYDITATSKNNANYDLTITYTGADKSTYTINKRPISVKVNDVATDSAKSYEEVYAMLTYSTIPGDVVGEDDLDVTYSITIGETEVNKDNKDNYINYVKGGEHTISATFGNDNYEYTVTNGVLTVSKPKVTVKDIVTEYDYNDGKAIKAFDWKSNIDGKLNSATESAFSATYYKDGKEIKAITEAGSYTMVISIVHTSEYEFAKDAVVKYTIIVNKKDISAELVIEGVSADGNNWVPQREGASVYANFKDDVNKYAEVRLNETTKLGDDEWDSSSDMYELGSYTYTATVADDNYTGSITVTFRVIPDVAEKMEDFASCMKDYSASANSSTNYKALTSARAIAKDFTADDMLQIKANAEYSKAIASYQAAYKAFMQSMREDVAIAHDMSTRRLATAMSAMTTLAVLFWFGSVKH